MANNKFSDRGIAGIMPAIGKACVWVMVVALAFNGALAPFLSIARAEEFQPTTEAIAAINAEVNGYITYGNGPQIEGRAPTRQEILDFGEGHCGEYAYLLGRELSSRGVDFIAYAITSEKGPTVQANHTLVEVETSEGPRVFDPTYNVYYLADMDTLTTCNDISEYGVGLENVDVYNCTDRFFKEIIVARLFPSFLDQYDLNLIDWTENEVRTSLPKSGKTIEEDPALDEGTISIHFKEPQNVYRIKLLFTGRLPKDVGVTCVEEGENGEMIPCEGHVKQKTYQLDFETTAPVNTRQLTLSVSFPGKRKPRINRVAVFQW